MMTIKIPIGDDDAAQISAIEDPALRNVWITQAYADFASRLRPWTGSADRTWCSFAVWASVTAGQSIRREELGAIFDDILATHHRDAIAEVNARLRPAHLTGRLEALGEEMLRRCFEDALDTISERIAHGNTLVFGELAPLFVAFLDLLESGGHEDPPRPAELDLKLQRAAAGALAPDVRSAFHCYLAACSETDPMVRAQHILAGNVLAVAHEQQRLQADLAAAMSAGLVPVDHVVAEMLPRRWRRLADRVVKLLGGRMIERLLGDVCDSIETRVLMVLRVPGTIFWLGHDVPRPSNAVARWPDELSELAGAAATVYERWDRTGGTRRGSGAHDWSHLGQRMNYIVNLFRGWQREPELALPPFGTGQVATMMAGTMPPPPLVPDLASPAR